MWHGQTQVPLLSSFQPEALRAARDAAPELRALLLDTLHSQAFDLAQQLRCVALITNQQLMDATLLARIHAAGMRALVYTVNEPERAQQLLAWGIDGIVTDAVDRFSPV